MGYAGLTIPFAYAIAALIVNDPSREWVVRIQRYALFSWLFLGIGIGLGAVWAYVVLGWGGYWGWDAVENASLLSWLVGVALIHSFTVYRQRGAFKRWSVMCACITFAFVIVGTFISRSGLVQSVHAFEGDPVSLVLFGALIVVALLAGVVGLVVRWKSFGPVADGCRRGGEPAVQGRRLLLQQRHHDRVRHAAGVPDRVLGVAWRSCRSAARPCHCGHVQRHRPSAGRRVPGHPCGVPAVVLGQDRGARSS